MTWDDFKQHVDRIIQAAGHDSSRSDIEVSFIDMNSKEDYTVQLKPRTDGVAGSWLSVQPTRREW